MTLQDPAAIDALAMPSIGDHFGEHFYGRRKGRPLSPEAKRILEDIAQYQFELTRLDPTQQNWLEIGFGGGEHLIEQAKQNPTAHLIGAEAFMNGVLMALRQIRADSLTNVRLWPQDVRPLLDQLPAQSLDRIFLLFPDPWPKLRHHKRRFISPVNLNRLHRLLKPGGLFRVASDHPEYITWVKTHLKDDQRFCPQFDWEAMPTTRPETWFPTRYEQKALQQGSTCTYLEFRKP
jgi:tRNA (guanine-N7-)-methyltransferase